MSLRNIENILSILYIIKQIEIEIVMVSIIKLGILNFVLKNKKNIFILFYNIKVFMS